MKYEHMVTINLDSYEDKETTLINYARKLGKQLCLNPDRIAMEMECAGTYKELVSVFEKYFDAYVNLETDNPNLLNK